RAEFDQFMRDIQPAYPGIELSWEMIASCQGSRTDPDHWIVQSAVRAWEETHGKGYPGAPLMSGQTDAAAICQLGIALVRIGFPFRTGASVPEEFSDGLGGMGVASVADLVVSIKQMIYILIDACTRTRQEVVSRGAF